MAILQKSKKYMRPKEDVILLEPSDLSLQGKDVFSLLFNDSGTGLSLTFWKRQGSPIGHFYIRNTSGAYGTTVLPSGTPIVCDVGLFKDELIIDGDFPIVSLGVIVSYFNLKANAAAFMLAKLDFDRVDNKVNVSFNRAISNTGSGNQDTVLVYGDLSYPTKPFLVSLVDGESRNINMY